MVGKVLSFRELEQHTRLCRKDKRRDTKYSRTHATCSLTWFKTRQANLVSNCGVKPYSKYTPLNRLLSLTVALFEIGKANLESNTGVLGLLWTTHSQQAPAPPICPLPPSWNAQMFKYRSVNLKKVLNIKVVRHTIFQCFAVQ